MNVHEISEKYKCVKIFLPNIINILSYFKWKNETNE